MHLTMTAPMVNQIPWCCCCQRMDRPGVRQVLEGSGEQGQMAKTGCKIICGAPTTLAVKGLMMMMMMMMIFVMSQQDETLLYRPTIWYSALWERKKKTYLENERMERKYSMWLERKDVRERGSQGVGVAGGGGGGWPERKNRQTFTDKHNSELEHEKTGTRRKDSENHGHLQSLRITTTKKVSISCSTDWRV